MGVCHPGNSTHIHVHYLPNVIIFKITCFWRPDNTLKYYLFYLFLMYGWGYLQIVNMIVLSAWHQPIFIKNNRPLGLTAPLPNNTLYMIHSPMNTQWPWFDISMPPKVKCHGVNWKTIYDLLHMFFMQNWIRCSISQKVILKVMWPWFDLERLSNVKCIEVNW